MNPILLGFEVGFVSRDLQQLDDADDLFADIRDHIGGYAVIDGRFQRRFIHHPSIDSEECVFRVEQPVFCQKLLAEHSLIDVLSIKPQRAPFRPHPFLFRHVHPPLSTLPAYLSGIGSCFLPSSVVQAFSASLRLA